MGKGFGGIGCGVLTRVLTTFSPGFIHQMGELWNTQDPWKISQHTPNINSGLQTLVDTPLTHPTLKPQATAQFQKNVSEG